MYIYIHTHTYIYTHTHIYTYIYVCIYVCIFIYMEVNNGKASENKEKMKKKQKVTEWGITKTVVENKIEIFMALTKYNTHQRREESTHCLWWLLSQLYWYLLNTPPTGRVRHKAFLRLDRRRVVGQTPAVAPKMTRASAVFPWKGHLAHPKRIRAWGDGSLRLMDGQLRDVNARFSRHSHQAASTEKQLT